MMLYKCVPLEPLNLLAVFYFLFRCEMDDYSSLSHEELIFKLQSADHIICEQRKLLQSKDTMLQSYIQQFNQLTADYERLIESHYMRNEHPDVAIPVDPPVQSRRESYSRPDPSQSTFAEPPSVPQPQALPGKRALVSQISFGEDLSMDQRPISSVKQDRAIPRTAMNDHFHEHFGEPLAAPSDQWQAPIADSGPAFIDTSGMTIDQMRAKVDELNIQRAEMERQLNKVLPKGKVMSHVIREREELEKQFNDLTKVIARIKLEIRQSQNRDK